MFEDQIEFIKASVMDGDEVYPLTSLFLVETFSGSAVNFEIFLWSLGELSIFLSFFKYAV